MNYMDIALKMAEKAAKNKEIPVGAIIVLNDKIIAKSYNKKEKNNKVIAHAEVNCILKASKKLRTWKLDNCEMYVTLKPCSMCETIIKQSRIKKVYYLLEKDDSKKEFYKTEISLYEDEKLKNLYYSKLKFFFNSLRK